MYDMEWATLLKIIKVGIWPSEYQFTGGNNLQVTIIFKLRAIADGAEAHCYRLITEPLPPTSSGGLTLNSQNSYRPK